MKKHLIVLLSSILILYPLCAKKTPLQTKPAEKNFVVLCNLALKNNLSLKKEQMNTNEQKRAKNLNFLNFLPSFVVLGNLSYEEDGFEKEYPLFASISGTISQNFPWGAQLFIEPVLNYEQVDAQEDKNNYDFSGSATVELYQSLVPFFWSIKGKNPDTFLPKLYYKQAENSLKTQEYEILNQLLNYMIQIRSLYRNLELVNYNLELYQLRFESVQELCGKGDASKMNFYSERQNYYNAKKQKTTLLDQKESLLESFLQFLNYCLTEEELEEFVCNICKSNTNFTDFSSAYNFWNYSYIQTLTEMNFTYQKDYIKTVFLLERQNNAPKLIITGECSYNPETNHSFSAGIGFDLSSLFSPSTLTLRKNYKEQEKLLLEQEQQNRLSEYKSTETMKKNLKILEEQKLELINDYEAMKAVYKDYETLFGRMECSRMNYLEMQSSYYQSLYELENIEDRINYYKLLLNVEISE